MWLRKLQADGSRRRQWLRTRTLPFDEARLLCTNATCNATLPCAVASRQRAKLCVV